MDPVGFRSPATGDGAQLWRLARDSGVLDVNSPYYYLLFCTRFAASSIVAHVDERVVGFVTGLRAPDPATLFVWQVGVDASMRGRGVASAMLDALLASQGCHGVRRLETSVTPSNEASLALFRGLARRRGAAVKEHVLFAAADFPEEGAHEPEVLLRITPLGGGDAEGRP